MKRLVALVGLVACSGGTPPPHAPTELVIPAIAPAGGAAVAPSARKKGGLCTVGLATWRVEVSSPTCYLDQRIDEGGLLTYPCSGEDGEARATFQDKLEYVGTIRSGEVELESRSELDSPGDKCRWGTIGTIRGTLLVGGEVTQQKLQWTYADRVVSGENCSGTCRATASLDVSLTE